MERMVDWTGVREELRRLRATNNFTLDELAQESGVERTTIYRIESTKKLPGYTPDLESIDALARAFDMTLADFFARVEGKRLATEPALTEGVTDGRPLPDSRGSSALDRTFILAVAEQLATAVTAAIDRLIAARSEDRAPARNPTVRRRRG